MKAVRIKITLFECGATKPNLQMDRVYQAIDKGKVNSFKAYNCKWTKRMIHGQPYRA